VLLVLVEHDRVEEGRVGCDGGREKREIREQRAQVAPHFALAEDVGELRREELHAGEAYSLRVGEERGGIPRGEGAECRIKTDS
jgi:hypothetical protein